MNNQAFEGPSRELLVRLADAPSIQAHGHALDELRAFLAKPAELPQGAPEWSDVLLPLEVVREAHTSRDSAERLKNMDAGKVLREAIDKLKAMRASEHQGAPAEFAFQSMLNLGWSADAVVRSMIDQGPLYRKPPVSHDDTAALRRVYDAFGLGYNHHVSVLLANIETTKRFSDYLGAVEREFFMVPGEPSEEPEDEGCEPADDCLVNCWGSSQEQYLEQFRAALTTLAEKHQGKLQDRQAVTDRLLYELLKHGRLVGWEPVLISHLEEHLKSGAGAGLSKFIQIVDDCYHLASSYSPCLDNVDEHGGDDHEDPTCAIFHRLYYAMFLVRKPTTGGVNHG